MRAINRKLFREVWKHRGQMLSIGAVVAVGIMTVLTMRGTYESLVVSQELYYRDTRFPDVWARLERAPESLRRRIEDLPGVAVADSRVSFAATLDVPGVDVPALGQFVSVPEDRRPRLSDLHIKTGRYLAPGRRNEVVISENFALANGFVPGDTLEAVINGRLRDLEIVGTAISPEYSYAVPPGSLYPDDERYGIVWMSRKALGPAYDMEGAFNEVVLTFSPRPKVVGPLLPMDVRHFEADSEAAAWAWLREEGKPEERAAETADEPGIEEIPTSKPGVLAFSVTDDLTAADYEQTFTPKLEAAAREHGQVDLLLRFENFEGMSLGAMKEDASLAPFLDQIHRIAAIGGPDWMAKTIEALGSLAPVDVRHFESDEAAWAWLGAEPVPAT